MKLSRKQFLRLGGSGLFSALAGLGYSTLVEPGRLSLEQVCVKIPRLPLALEGFRIAVLSDFHFLPFTQIDHIAAAVDLANTLKADLAVLLGDFVDETVESIHELAPHLARLNAKHGVLGVLGNHDHWKDAKIVRSAFAQAGLPMLQNSGRTISVGGTELFVAGIESAWAGRPDLSRALADRRSDTPVVLLAHEPDFADTAAQDGRIALQLSGHTHGGQVRLPLIGALELPSWGRRYDHGLYRIGGMRLYTNRGIGLVDIPVRFNCPPEVTEVVLVGG